MITIVQLGMSTDSWTTERPTVVNHGFRNATGLNSTFATNHNPGEAQTMIQLADSTIILPSPTEAIISNLPSLEANQQTWDWRQARLTQPTADAFELVFEYLGLKGYFKVNPKKSPTGYTLEATLENTTTTPVSLGKVYLLDAALPASMTQNLTELVFLPLAGNLFPRKVWRIDDPNAPLTSKIKTVYFQRALPQATLIGFVTFHRIDTNISHSIDAHTRGCRVKAWCDFNGWKLWPGRSISLETLSLTFAPEPVALLTDWTAAAAARCTPRQWEDAPIGYLGWAWVDPFHVENYEATVLRNCAAIRRRLPGYAINYVWISIGNLATGSPGEWTDWNYKNFPNGPEFLNQKMQAMGFRWGFWCAPLWICGNQTEKLKHLQDALLKNPNGTIMVPRKSWSYGNSGQLPPDQRPPIYQLDPTHPKTHEFLRQTFETYRRWGVRYFMIDFIESTAGIIDRYPYLHYYNEQYLPGPEAYHLALKIIRETVGDDTYLLTSTGPSVHNAGFADAIRTGTDFGEGRSITPNSFFYPATYVINSGAFWTGPALALQNQASNWYTHRKLYQNNAGNVLTVDQPLPLRDARIHATIHALSGASSMLGDDIDRMSEERLTLIKKT